MKHRLSKAARAVGGGAAAVLVLLVRGYQALVSPMLGARCRYAPSCSQYAVEALRVHGLVRWLGLAVWRVLRCHPFSRSGYDPVPPRAGRGGPGV